MQITHISSFKYTFIVFFEKNQMLKYTLLPGFGLLRKEPDPRPGEEKTAGSPTLVCYC